MSFYGLGIEGESRRAEIVHLCRKHSTESVQNLARRIGTGELLVQWNSTPIPGLEEKEPLIDSIRSAVSAFEALDVPLAYYYRVTSEDAWERVDRGLFLNLLSSDLKTWHEVRNLPD